MAQARPDIGTGWFVLTTRTQHERVVSEQLTAQSLEAYVPLYRSRRRWSDRVKIIEAPLFPQYVFCRFPFESRLKVTGIPSVVSIVGFGGIPAVVRQEEIDILRRLEGQDQVMPWPFLRVGGRVRVCDGPLAGLEGILVREKAAYRVVVNIEMLQRAVAVEIERDLLQPVRLGPASQSAELSHSSGSCVV